MGTPFQPSLQSIDLDQSGKHQPIPSNGSVIPSSDPCTGKIIIGASRFIRLVLLGWILSITIGRIVPLQGMHGVLDSPHVSSLRVDDEVNEVCDTCHTVSFLIVPLPHSNRRPACRDRISKLTCCISGDGLDQASKYVARLTP